MKSLFNSDFSWTDEGNDVDEECIKALEPIFSKYMKMGYSPREIAEICHGATEDRKHKSLVDHKNSIKKDK